MVDVTDFFWTFVRAAAVLDYDDLVGTSLFSRMKEAVTNGRSLLLEPRSCIGGDGMLLERHDSVAAAETMRGRLGQCWWNDDADAYEFADVNALFDAVAELIPTSDARSRATLRACTTRIHAWLEALAAADDFERLASI